MEPKFAGVPTSKLLSKYECIHNPIFSYYDSLYESKKYADTVLVLDDGVELFTHRLVLAQSPVFASMFENVCNCLERQTIKLTDLLAPVAEEMLRYLYTGHSKQYTVELLIAAEKV